MSLTGNQINNTYQGLLKTESNGAISGLTNVTDGLGNQTGLFVDPSANTVGISGSATLFNIKNTGVDKTQYPMGSVATQINFQDVNGLDIFEIAQDSYGSSYYTNINGDQGEQHIFRSKNQAGNITGAKISMNSYNNINNSANWFTAYNERITAGSYDNVAGELTLTKPNSADTVITLPMVTSITGGSGISVNQATGDVTISATGGGGGGATPAMTVDMLPAIASDPSNNSWKNGETIIGYTYQNIDCGGGFTPWKVMPMAEGEEINELYFNVRVAGVQAGTTVQIGIYELETATDGTVVMGDLLKDCGNIAATTTGDKFVDISSSPFVMPAGSTFGAVGIMIGNNNGTDPLSIAGWNNGGLNSAWSNGVGNIAAGTVYRAVRRTYNGWPLNNQLPANASTRADYDSETAYPLVIMVR